MPPPRPRGVGCTTGIVPARPNPNTPMSERQQMALLIQMTATSSDHSRSHQKGKRCDEMEEILHQTEKLDAKTCETNAEKKDNDTIFDVNVLDVSASLSKRNFSDIDEDDGDDNDEIKKKRRKDTEVMKDKHNIRSIVNKLDKCLKPGNLKTATAINRNSNLTIDKDDIKLKTLDTEADEDDLKNEVFYSGGLKVPPLKIVIPQHNCTIETDGSVSRAGKISISCNSALPYVVSSNNDCNDATQPADSPNKVNTSSTCNVVEEKYISKTINEDKNLRVLRSSHRSGAISHDRNSNNPSPQMQSNSPSPASSSAIDITDKLQYTNSNSPLSHINACLEQENVVNISSPSTSSTSSSKDVISNNIELHPRKRKIRSKNDEIKSHTINNINSDVTVCTDSHPHDLPFTNCFQMYMNIRRQIEKKWRNIVFIRPRPPQGYNEYLINTRNYLLNSNQNPSQTISILHTIPQHMREIYLVQERDRRELHKRHVVERQKLCLNVEQEIIRVHSKAARNISCQSLPFSVCTFIKDEEVYNVIIPEHDEKDKNARYRFNGRLLLSWLQDVDDKWEKIKESMILRHHNEAESLQAVQLMDWEIALKKHELYGYGGRVAIDSDHVPMVHVDDFDLLPA